MFAGGSNSVFDRDQFRSNVQPIGPVGAFSGRSGTVHLMNPRDVVPESNMPGYPWLARNEINSDRTGKNVRTLRTLGVPYIDEQIDAAAAAVEGRTEIEALIAYLQDLGTTRSAREIRAWISEPCADSLP